MKYRIPSQNCGKNLKLNTIEITANDFQYMFAEKVKRLPSSQQFTATINVSVTCDRK